MKGRAKGPEIVLTILVWKNKRTIKIEAEQKLIEEIFTFVRDGQYL